MAAGSPSSSGTRDLVLPASTSPVPSPSTAARSGPRSTQSKNNPVALPALARLSIGAAATSSTLAGSSVKTPARLPTSPPSRSKIKDMLARAAKARGPGKQTQKKSHGVTPPVAKILPTAPPSAASS